VKKTFRPEVMTDIGSFGGLFKLDMTKYKEPVLVSGTDGVGTKLKIAFMTGRHDTVGIDLVAMCVNDILTLGAEPLFFLDYFATGKLDADRHSEVVKGIAEGCKQAGCALIGGETAEMPGFYSADEYDMAGFAVGVVDKNEVVDGSRIAEGDALIGIASSGIHSNGYSLVRKVLFEAAGLTVESQVPELRKSLGEELITPTRIYVKGIQALKGRVDLKGMAHITGGGIPGNLPRILRDGFTAVVKEDSWEVPAIFRLVQKLGNVPSDDLKRTLNMGIGYVLVIDPKDTDTALSILAENGYEARRIGRIEKGTERIRYE
jgi:phosphoribosylformylglycinamidine cyclo-ligase